MHDAHEPICSKPGPIRSRAGPPGPCRCLTSSGDPLGGRRLAQNAPPVRRQTFKGVDTFRGSWRSTNTLRAPPYPAGDSLSEALRSRFVCSCLGHRGIRPSLLNRPKSRSRSEGCSADSTRTVPLTEDEPCGRPESVAVGPPLSRDFLPKLDFVRRVLLMTDNP